MTLGLPLSVMQQWMGTESADFGLDLLDTYLERTAITTALTTAGSVVEAAVNGTTVLQYILKLGRDEM
jgi:hypothetical protein